MRYFNCADSAYIQIRQQMQREGHDRKGVIQMKYSKCNACGYIFENAKLDPDEEMAEPTCPNCRSNDFNGTTVNELNIILFDDGIRLNQLSFEGKKLIERPGFKMSDSKFWNINKAMMYKYQIAFRASDFIDVYPDELAKYILQFINDTSKYEKPVSLIIKFIDEMKFLQMDQSQRIFENQYLLQANLQMCLNGIFKDNIHEADKKVTCPVEDIDEVNYKLPVKLILRFKPEMKSIYQDFAKNSKNYKTITRKGYQAAYQMIDKKSPTFLLLEKDDIDYVWVQEEVVCNTVEEFEKHKAEMSKNAKLITNLGRSGEFIIDNGFSNMVKRVANLAVDKTVRYSTNGNYQVDSEMVEYIIDPDTFIENIECIADLVRDDHRVQDVSTDKGNLDIMIYPGYVSEQAESEDE